MLYAYSSWPWLIFLKPLQIIRNCDLRVYALHNWFNLFIFSDKSYKVLFFAHRGYLQALKLHDLKLSGYEYRIFTRIVESWITFVDRIGGVIVSVPALSAVDRGFEAEWVKPKIIKLVFQDSTHITCLKLQSNLYIKKATLGNLKMSSLLSNRLKLYALFINLTGKMRLPCIGR
jgi:hypothetical protein